MNQDLITRAIDVIANSSLADHNSAVSWGQWCRELAQRVQDRDEEEVTRLIEEGDKRRHALNAD